MDLIDKDSLKEIKLKLVENSYTRDDLLKLVNLLEELEEAVDELEEYLSEEFEINNEDDFTPGPDTCW